MHSSIALSLFCLAILKSQRAAAYGPPNGQWGQWGGQPPPAVVTTTVPAPAQTTTALNILQEDQANGHVYATAPVGGGVAPSSSSSSSSAPTSVRSNNVQENYAVNGQRPASSQSFVQQQPASQVQQQPSSQTGSGSQQTGGTTSGSTSGSTSSNTQNTTPSGQQSGNGKTCIYWEGDFAYRMDGGFGSATGTGSSASKCWDNSISNAAIYICDSNGCNGGGKYTKFEATLNTNFPTIDVSLVDGYSRPVHCTWTKDGSPVSVGGTEDMYDLNKCPTPGKDNTCINVGGPIDQAHGGSYAAMATFFKAGNSGSNAYCDYTICEETPNVSLPALDPNSPSTITCVVGKTKGVNAKVKRDPAVEELAAPAEVMEAEKRSDENATDFTSTLKGLARRALRSTGSGGAHVHARSLKHAHA